MYSIRPAIVLWALCCLMALPVSAQQLPGNPPEAPKPPAAKLPDGVTSAKEYHAYIVGLYQRRFYDLAAQEAANFEACYPRHPLSEEILRIRIESLSSIDNNAAAAAAVKLYLRDYPKSSRREEMFSRSAAINYNLRNYPAAAADYTQLLESKDRALAEAAAYFLAQCLLAEGKTDDARGHLAALAGRELSAKHIYRLYAKQYLAAECFQRGDYDAALKGYQTLLAIPGLPRELRQEILIPAADLYQAHRRDFKAASKHYGAFAVEFASDTRSQYARRSLLSCLFHMENYSQFLLSAATYLKDYPNAVTDDPELLSLNIRAQLHEKHPEAALASVKSLEECPKSLPAHHQFAAQSRIYSLAALQRHEEVVQAAENYLAAYPSASDKVDILVKAGAAAEQLQKSGDAIRYYRQAMALAATDAAISQQIGEYLARYLTTCGQWADASALYEELAQRTADASRRPMLALAAADAAYRAKDYVRSEALARHLAATAEVPAQQKQHALTIAYAACSENGQYALAAGYALAITELQDAEPRVRPVWLEKAGAACIGAKDYARAIDCYAAAADSPALDAASRPQLLLRLIELLLYEKRHEEAGTWGARLLLKDQPPFNALASQEILRRLAAVSAETRPDVAQAAWRLLQKAPECPVALRIDCLEHLADSLLAGAPAEAAACVSQLETMVQDDNGHRKLPPLGASVAAEIALESKQYSAALQHANSVLENTAPTVPLRAIARSRWVKAKVLRDYDNDLKGALSLATMGFVISQRNDAIYTPRSRQLAADILRLQGHDTQADEILKE